MGDSLYDLIDYCYRKLTEQLRIQSSQDANNKKDEGNKSNEIMEVRTASCIFIESFINKLFLIRN